MDAIVLKIQKLLSLANSDNEHEARLAAEKASELLLRHNLSMAEVRRTSADYTKGVVRESSWTPTEEKYVLSLITAHFFVRGIREGTGRRGENGKREKRIVLLGTPTNVEIATYMYEFLMREFRLLWQAYKKANGAQEGSRASYYFGLYQGLHAQLDARRAAVQAETGLVVREDTALSAYLREQFGEARTARKQTVNARDAAALAAGTETGRQLNLRRGIGGAAAGAGGAPLQLGPRK
jgi:hypothetical protein